MARSGFLAAGVCAVSAASVAADILGMSDTIGRLAPGYSADVIAVEGNPLEDATVLEKVDFVMVRGSVIE